MVWKINIYEAVTKRDELIYTKQINPAVLYCAQSYQHQNVMTAAQTGCFQDSKSSFGVHQNLTSSTQVKMSERQNKFMTNTHSEHKHFPTVNSMFACSWWIHHFCFKFLSSIIPCAYGKELQKLPEKELQGLPEKLHMYHTYKLQTIRIHKTPSINSLETCHIQIHRNLRHLANELMTQV